MQLIRKPSGAGIVRTAKSLSMSLLRVLFTFSPLLVVWAAPRFLGNGASIIDYYSDHLGLIAYTATPVLVAIVYWIANYQRTHPPKPARGRPRRLAKPPYRAFRQVVRDTVDMVLFLDHIPLRIIYLALFGAAIWLPTHTYALTVDDFQALKSITDTPDALTPILRGLAAPLGFYTVLIVRSFMVVGRRAEAIGLIYAVARDTLGYPKTIPKTSPTPRQRLLCTPHLAVDVKSWRELYEINEAFVAAPEELSVTDLDKWDSFDVNLNAKAPRKEEWRVQRDPRGRGAKITAANYPLGVLWDGEIDNDPLTFVVGVDLESNETHRITLGEVSPHAAISGGTSSGKTSFAEIIAAQVLIKPMPWDPTLYGQVNIVDPKGPFARRWAGRPGVIASNGQEDAGFLDDDGEAITGPVVMAMHMEHIEAEHKRRAAVLARYPDVGTWVHLPDEVKREEKFFPILVILDEYLDHTDMESSKGDERIEKENLARATTTRMANWHARKYRNVGMHTMLIAQEVKMTAIGSALMRNLPIRVVTGQMDRTQLMTMFATEPDNIPSLPATRVVEEDGVRRTKTIPGRARIMNAIGQTIHKVQIMWFGGPSNSETLDKWLPRGEAPPNGDFTLPEGQPRKPGDEDPAPAPSAPAPGTDEAGEGDADGDGIPDGAEVPDEAPEEPVFPAAEAADLTEDEEDPWLAASVPVEPDPDQVFPTAGAETPSCADETCVNDAARSCGQCGRIFCEHHLGSAPDPDDNRLWCAECIQNHPLCLVDAADLYGHMYQQARAAGLVASYTVDPSSGAVTATTRTARNKKVVEFIATPDGKVTGRSRAGTVTGTDRTWTRIEEVIGGYIERQGSEAGDPA